MKLVDKFTLWFLGVIVVTTPITSYICLNNIERKIDDVEIARLKIVNTKAAARMADGTTVNIPRDASFTTFTLLPTLPADSFRIRKDPDPDGNHQSMESRLTVSTFMTINGKPYEVTTSSYIPASRQILNAILDTVAWKLLLIILCVAVSARFLSARILHTLRLTMRKIHNFDLKKKINFPQTNTEEFKELNTFLKKMTDKAVEEYTAVKQFSENASHELQTPLAVIRGKLELLSETNIDEDQATLLADMHHAIEKLSKINRSLILLSKMENNEFAVTEHIKFCRVAKDVLAAYEDRLEMKNIQVKKELDKNIQLRIHPVLADMLMNNLLGNAIRHNVQDGTIHVILKQEKLVIKNTGLPPETPTEELFERFRKSNQCSESVGLGLAIVKQICEVCDFKVSYKYKAPLHILQVDFCPGSVINEEQQDKFETASVVTA